MRAIMNTLAITCGLLALAMGTTYAADAAAVSAAAFDLHAWFLVHSWFDLPRYVWALLTGLAILENLLGRSKNPRLRSVAAVAATALNWLIEKSRIATIPVAGPMIVTVLRAITGDKNGNGIPDDQETPPAPPADPPGVAVVPPGP